MIFHQMFNFSQMLNFSLMKKEIQLQMKFKVEKGNYFFFIFSSSINFYLILGLPLLPTTSVILVKVHIRI